MSHPHRPRPIHVPIKMREDITNRTTELRDIQEYLEQIIKGYNLDSKKGLGRGGGGTIILVLDKSS